MISRYLMDSIGVLLAAAWWSASECDQSLFSGVHRRVISYGLVDITNRGVFSRGLVQIIGV